MMLVSRHKSRLRKLAFTLVEVVIALAVILILAAVALPSLTGYLDQKAVETTAAQLVTVRDALYNTTAGAIAFRQKIGRNAGRLSQLSRVLVEKNAGYLDSCGFQYAKGQVNQWESNGPFVNFNIDPVSGMTTPIGSASDVLTRIPAGAGVGNLRINFLSNVEVGQVELLDQLVDAGDGLNTGTIQWLLPAVNGQVTMYYFVPIDALC